MESNIKWTKNGNTQSILSNILDMSAGRADQDIGMQDSEHSVYREKMIEHLFVGELLKLSWQKGDRIELSNPEVNVFGYDLIAETKRVIRHIKLRTSYVGSTTTRQNVHVRLADKPSGCIVWIFFDKETLHLGPYQFFGNLPGQPLPDISDSTATRRAKGDRHGHKAERPNVRTINRGKFVLHSTIGGLYESLFGRVNR